MELEKDIHFRKFNTQDEAKDELMSRISCVGSFFFDLNRMKPNSHAQSIYNTELPKIQNATRKSPAHIDRTQYSSYSFRANLTAQGAMHGEKVNIFSIINRNMTNSPQSPLSIKSRVGRNKNKSNELIYNLGTYGTGKKDSILTVMYQITKYNYTKKKKVNDLVAQKKHEKKLAKEILCCCMKNTMLSSKRIFQINPTLKKLSKDDFERLRKRINNVIYLIREFEIIRYPKYEKSQGFMHGKQQKGEKTSLSQEFSAISILWSLQCVAKGSLSLQDIFSRDSKYNFVTGQKLRSQNSNKFDNKIFRLSQKWVETYYPESFKQAQLLNEIIIPCSKKIRATFGITSYPEDSPGIIYTTPNLTVAKKLREEGKSLRENGVMYYEESNDYDPLIMAPQINTFFTPERTKKSKSDDKLLNTPISNNILGTPGSSKKRKHNEKHLVSSPQPNTFFTPSKKRKIDKDNNIPTAANKSTYIAHSEESSADNDDSSQSTKKYTLARKLFF